MSVIQRVFYASRASANCDAAAIQAILQSSRRNNARLDVTGCLLFSGSYFAQVVEGRPDAVQMLLDRIRTDARHASFRILKEQASTSRDYGSWSMGYLYDLSLEEDLRDLLEGSGARDDRVSYVMDRMGLDTVLGSLG